MSDHGKPEGRYLGTELKTNFKILGGVDLVFRLTYYLFLPGGRYFYGDPQSNGLVGATRLTMRQLSLVARTALVATSSRRTRSGFSHPAALKFCRSGRSRMASRSTAQPTTTQQTRMPNSAHPGRDVARKRPGDGRYGVNTPALALGHRPAPRKDWLLLRTNGCVCRNPLTNTAPRSPRNARDSAAASCPTGTAFKVDSRR